MMLVKSKMSFTPNYQVQFWFPMKFSLSENPLFQILAIFLQVKNPPNPIKIMRFSGREFFGWREFWPMIISNHEDFKARILNCEKSIFFPVFEGPSRSWVFWPMWVSKKKSSAWLFCHERVKTGSKRIFFCANRNFNIVGFAIKFCILKKKVLPK